MWTCPSCGRRFKQSNQMHTCGVFDLERHLVGKSSSVVALYHLLAAAICKMREVEVVPMKSSILFRVKTVFATVTVRRNWLDLNFSMSRELPVGRIRRIDQASAGRFVHAVRLSSPDDIDDELLGWLADARALSAV